MEKKKISAETIIRTIVLVFVLVNQTLTMLGKNPLPYSEETIYEFFTAAFTVIASLWAWWKNNSFTKEAIAADEYMNALRADEFVQSIKNNKEGET